MTTKIIAFEGIDGSGKTSLIRSLRNHIRKQGFHVIAVANPNMLLKASLARYAHQYMQKNEMSHVVRAMLYAALIIDNQNFYGGKKYDYVLIDRFINSTFAYNVFYPELSKKEAYNAEKVCSSIIELFLQADVDTLRLPQLLIMLRSKEPINAKYMPLDYKAMDLCYIKANETTRRLYNKAGLQYNEVVFDPAEGQDNIYFKVRKLIFDDEVKNKKSA